MNTSLLPAPPPSGSGTQTHFLYSDSESILGLGKSASLGGQPHYKTCLYLGTVQMQMSKAGQMQESGTHGERPPAMQKALKGPWRPRSCFSVNRPHPGALAARLLSAASHCQVHACSPLCSEPTCHATASHPALFSVTLFQTSHGNPNTYLSSSLPQTAIYLPSPLSTQGRGHSTSSFQPPPILE